MLASSAINQGSRERPEPERRSARLFDPRRGGHGCEQFVHDPLNPSLVATNAIGFDTSVLGYRRAQPVPHDVRRFGGNVG